MRFQVLTFVTAALSAASSVVAQSTPDNLHPAGVLEQRIDGTVDLAGKTLASVQALRTGANINVIGPSIVDSFRTLIDKTFSTALFFNILPESDYTEDDQRKMCASLTKLIDIDTQIIKAFFDQANTTTGTKFQGPLHAQLRTFEGVVDKYYNGVIKQTPVCKLDVTTEFLKLAAATRLAIIAI